MTRATSTILPFSLRVLIKTNYLKYFHSLFCFFLLLRAKWANFSSLFNCAWFGWKKQHTRKGLARAATRKWARWEKYPRASHVDWQIGVGGEGTGCNQHPSPFANERFAVGLSNCEISMSSALSRFIAKFCKLYAISSAEVDRHEVLLFLINFLGLLNELKTRSEN